MIELSITTKNAAPPALATPVSGAAPGGFARALDAVSDAPPPPPPGVEPRQDDAVNGKNLPVLTAAPADLAPAVPAKPVTARRHGKVAAEPVLPGDALPILPIAAKSSSPDSDDAPAADGATAGDTDKTAPITAIIAVPAAPIMIDPSKLPAPAPRPSGSMTGGTALVAAPVPPAAPVAPDPVLTAPPAPDTLAATPASTGTTALPIGVELIDPGTPSKIAKAPTDPVAIAAPRIVAQRETPRFVIAPATAPTDPATLAVQPARQAFAAALAVLSARAPARDKDTPDLQQPIAGLAAPTADTLLKTAVQQIAASDQSALDPRHDRGLHGMIDHIEALRDDANARDTRIRLTPDALGTVDVALRRDGEAVHVRFSSANEATRLVLNDAQPRLAALAEARGVRIAGSSIDSGTNEGWGGGGQPQPQPRTESPRPARAPRAAAAADTDIPSDQRLA